MLSICIPVYNFEVYPLIKELSQQSEDAEVSYEIIVLDDASNDEFKTKNRDVKDISGVKYEELDENIGRSRIRNLLNKMASHPYLLFMDCDALILNENFISNYLAAINSLEKKDSLICGGRIYSIEKPNDSKSLHWVWGNLREAFDSEKRCENPYQSFMTNNFVVSKNVLNRIPFNEELSGYGHEDTLLGFELYKEKIPIIHIDNPVEHIGLEEAEIILEKTNQSIINLLKIYEITNKDPDFVNISKLLKAYEKIKKYGFRKFVVFLFKVFKKPVEKKLKSKSPSIRVFDLYKLGLICSV